MGYNVNIAFMGGLGETISTLDYEYHFFPQDIVPSTKYTRAHVKYHWGRRGLTCSLLTNYMRKVRDEVNPFLLRQ